MEAWLLKVGNYTEAVRGKNYLQGLNIKCAVEKAVGSGGCGYAIKVWGSAERASRLLSTAGINVVSVTAAKGK